MPTDRRSFLKTAGGAAAALLASRFGEAGTVGPPHLQARVALDPAPAKEPRLPDLFSNRFLTFNSVIRVNQIEVRRA